MIRILEEKAILWDLRDTELVKNCWNTTPLRLSSNTPRAGRATFTLFEDIF